MNCVAALTAACPDARYRSYAFGGCGGCGVLLLFFFCDADVAMVWSPCDGCCCSCPSLMVEVGSSVEKTSAKYSIVNSEVEGNATANRARFFKAVVVTPTVELTHRCISFLGGVF